VGAGEKIKSVWKALSLVKQVLAVLFFFCAIPATYVTITNGWDDLEERWNDRDKPAGEFDRTPRVGLEFWQDEELAPMLYRDASEQAVRVALDPKPFTMKAPAVDDKTAIEVCAWTDVSRLRYLPDPSRTVPAERIPCMGLGRGVADENRTSGRLFLNPEGRNYLIGDRLRKSGDMSQAFFSRTNRRDVGDVDLTDQEDPIYLLVYIDRNADRRIERGEFEGVELTF
jgi:hypothetical protein